MADAKTAAPTRALGYMDDAVFWDRILADWGEQVPDLIYPASVWTYQQMRRDPQLSAILTAYTLPIRRATWQVDPAGCRPEVAQLVADDLGLPVAGSDRQGARKTRGVSWTDHVRAALLMLVFGHMGFELTAEVRGGQARLTGLWERMPASIAHLRINPDGSLAGIDQEPMPGAARPQIGAERLLWYVHEREGAAWQGQSLLRPAFAPWLLKREMQRVHATSNRRFGMGVPNMKAQPGSNPTPEQMQTAQRAASAIRAGDTAGMSTPPGFDLELLGLSGGTPDTLAFMKWLDQQMSRMALAGFLDLGDTPNGSRALGESFIDLFLMSIQSIAETIADTATRQAAARIVEWNFGVDEPVPAVTVADVGSQHSVTAESIGALMASGALTADPELEAYVRREYRLPPKAATAPAPQTPPAPPEPPKPAPGKVTASRRPPAGQMELPIAAASGSDDEQHQADWQDAQQRLQEAWDAALGAGLSAAILAAVLAALTSGGIGALATVTAPADATTALADALTAQMTALAADGVRQAAAEVSAQGVTAPAAEVDEETLQHVAEATAAVIAAGMVNGAVRAALSAASSAVPGAAPAASMQAVEAATRAALDGTAGPGSAGWVADNTGAALTTAQAAGRAVVFAAVEQAGHDVTFEAREHNDRSECDECRLVSGREYDDLSSALADYPAGRYRACLGGLRCRGRLVARIE